MSRKAQHQTLPSIETVEASKVLPSLDANATMARAFLLIDRLKLATLPVISQGSVVGVISARDVSELMSQYRASTPEQRSEGSPLTVGHFMTSPVRSVHGNAELSDALKMMLDQRVQAFVIENDQKQVVGSLSRDDLLDLFAGLLKENKTSVLEAFESLQQGAVKPI